MELGYTLLHRKIWQNSVLYERDKRYSRLEAWLDLVNRRAQGIDRNGLRRGEFQASYRLLAKSWRWSVDSVFRFMKTLEREGMIAHPEHLPERQAEHLPEHFIICNYDVYNPLPNGGPNAPPNANPNVLKKDKRKEKEGERESSPAGADAVDPSPSIESLRLSELLRQAIQVRDPKAKAGRLPDVAHWACDVDKLLRLDGRRVEEVEAVIAWCQNEGCFWGPNILSGRKLREKFDTMYGQMRRDAKGGSGGMPDKVGEGPRDAGEPCPTESPPCDPESRKVWEGILAVVEPRLNRQSFETWFRPLLCTGRNNGALQVRAPTEFFQRCFVENYLELLRAAAGEQAIEIRWRPMEGRPDAAELSSKRSVPALATGTPQREGWALDVEDSRSIAGG